MKWLISIFTIVILSLGSQTPAAASTYVEPKVEVVTMSEMAQAANLSFSKMSREIAVNSVIKKLKKQVNKTWYVFAGSSPRGWDCSGMVRWTYLKLGVNLRHSASAQKNAGHIVKHPVPGDIVAFGWRGWSGAQHVGIYIGNGKMIHSSAPGHRTSIMNISSWAKMNGNTKVTYTRILTSS